MKTELWFPLQQKDQKRHERGAHLLHVRFGKWEVDPHQPRAHHLCGTLRLPPRPHDPYRHELVGACGPKQRDGAFAGPNEMSERALYSGGPFHGTVATTEGPAVVKVNGGQYTRAGRTEAGLLLYVWEEGE